ncbi:MAG: bifunctional pyr operon transcriptional regulator/uracil phosphoribosyltransferase PyrR [Candidatus Omnitrophica bacterium]|jgi:pyrimidine operon attenuation protein/uracil phosphoribosyltransferase|nr:bifunctional pyr operon transcriptional regulator/uracil phosphoribosyltransferase PyrR [Candidatus Omnitrophota bacterium]
MNDNQEAKRILSSEDISRILYRLTHQIVEQNDDIQTLALIGIQTRGVYLAKRIQKIIKELKQKEPPLGILGITLYRDDLTVIGQQPVVKKTSIDFDVKDKEIILIDDVLFTGRTIRAALDEIMDFGRPKRIKLLVLIDRGHRELPIRADFVGKNIPTSAQESVDVRLSELDHSDEVLILKGK